MAPPDPLARAAGDRLTRRSNPQPTTGDGPQAVACDGVLRADTGAMMRRLVTGRPVRPVTEDLLDGVCRAVGGEGKRVFVSAWDNAAGHVSRRVTGWVAAHNGRVGRDGGCDPDVGGPVKAPWLHRIEPEGVRGQRAIVEPDRKRAADEVGKRVCEHCGCPLEPDLKQVP